MCFTLISAATSSESSSASVSKAAPVTTASASISETASASSTSGPSLGSEEADLGAPDVNVLQLGHPPVPVGHGHARHLAVHVVLGLDQLASINLSSCSLHSDDVALGLVQRLDWDSDNRHFKLVGFLQQFRQLDLKNVSLGHKSFLL